MTATPDLRLLIDRLVRLAAAEAWEGALNPSQAAALRYLAAANRFSRAPSQVAEYLAATRGTVSQTLIALERKGLIAAAPGADRRRISYVVTEAGQAALGPDGPQDREMAQAVAALVRQMLAARGGRPFGLCHECRHHEARGAGGWCRLLKVELAPHEAGQICHEQDPREAA
jgi:DNA-binding MarR family transcriptional regulator